MKKRIILSTLLILVTTSIFSQKIVWKPKAKLPSPTSASRAVSLIDRIIMVGGAPTYKNVYEYNPVSDAWTAKSSMATDKFIFPLVQVNNFIYAFGGFEYLNNTDELLHPYNYNECYDVVTDTWTEIAPLPTPRMHFKGINVGTTIYVIGGMNTEQTTVLQVNEAYNTETNTWETKAPIPVAKQNYSIAEYEGRIYVFGGQTNQQNWPWVTTSSVHVYDPEEDSWHELAAMPTPRCFASETIIDGKIIIVGGEDGINSTARVDIFDPTTEQWVASNPVPEALLTPASTSCDGKIYLFGGTIVNGTNWDPVDDSYEGTLVTEGNFTPEVYHPMPDTFALLGEVLHYRIPEFAFIDDDTLSYSATTATGDLLPSWLQFGANTFTASPQVSDTLNVIITATDNYGSSVSDTFQIIAAEEYPNSLRNEEGCDIRIYPNPASHTIMIEAEQNFISNAPYQIIDLTGKVLLHNLTVSGSIDVSSLNTGIYIIKVNLGGKLFSRKISIK